MKWIPWVLLLASLAGLGTFLYTEGVEDERARWVEIQSNNRKAIEELVEARNELRARLEAEAAEREAERQRTRAAHRAALAKATEAASACHLELDALRLLDASGTGVPPVAGTTGTADGGPAPVDTSCAAAIRICDENYALCRADRQNYQGLIEWNRQIRNTTTSGSTKGN